MHYGKFIILYVEVLKVDMIASVKQGVRGGSPHRLSGALSRAIGGPPIWTVKSKGGSIGGVYSGGSQIELDLAGYNGPAGILKFLWAKTGRKKL